MAQLKLLKLCPTWPISLSRPRMATTARPSKTEMMILLRSCASTFCPVQSQVKVKKYKDSRTAHDFELLTLSLTVLYQFHQHALHALGMHKCHQIIMQADLRRLIDQLRAAGFQLCKRNRDIVHSIGD